MELNNDEHKIDWQFDNSYARLPEHFYARMNPIPVQNPQTVIVNQALAGELGPNTILYSSTSLKAFV